MFVLTTTQQVPLTVAYKDAAGNPAVVDGDPVWAISDPAVAEIVAGADGFSVVVRATGVIGGAQVSVSADADMGEGIRTILATLDIEVVAGEAVAASIGAGVAEEQPAPVAEEPVVEEPAAEVPAEEAPVAETPAEEAPVAEEPAAEVPAEEAPVAEEPVAEAPVEEVPAEEPPVDPTV